jgi:hypothetical protein
MFLIENTDLPALPAGQEPSQQDGGQADGEFLLLSVHSVVSYFIILCLTTLYSRFNCDSIAIKTKKKLLAIFAVSSNSESVLHRFELVFTADFVLQFLNLVVPELDDLAAFDADHVIVVAVPINVLVHDHILAANGFSDQSTIEQQRNHPIDRSPGDVHFLLMQLREQCLHVKMRM